MRPTSPALRIASEKCAIPFGEAFVKGILCNLLVCPAVWLALAGRSVSDKIAAVVFPVTTFVAWGLARVPQFGARDEKIYRERSLKPEQLTE